jgi:hypothetical protein
MSFIPGGGGGGGGSGGGGVAQQLTLASDTITLSGNGGSVVVGDATSVATNTQNIAENTEKLTAQTFQRGGIVSDATLFASDIVIGTTTQVKNLTVNGSIGTNTLASKILFDSIGNPGANGQVLNVDSNSNLLWSDKALAQSYFDGGIGGVPTTTFNSRLIVAGATTGTGTLTTNYLATDYIYDSQKSQGTDGQVLSINSSGNLLWSSQSGNFIAKTPNNQIIVISQPTIILLVPSGLSWVAGDTAVVYWTVDVNTRFQAVVSSYADGGDGYWHFASMNMRAQVAIEATLRRERPHQPEEDPLRLGVLDYDERQFKMLTKCVMLFVMVKHVNGVINAFTLIHCRLQQEHLALDLIRKTTTGRLIARHLSLFARGGP